MPAPAPRITRPFERALAYYDERALGLLAVVADKLPEALSQVRQWHPRLSHSSDAAITDAFTLDDARLTYARQHGHESWAAFANHIDALARGRAREPFMEAFDALRAGDVPRLATLLDAAPELVGERGTNGNSLLNLAASLSARCRVPAAAEGADALSAVRLLLDRGADAGSTNDRGWTPLHQAGYSNQPGLVQALLAAGASASAEAHGSGGTPLAVSLFWGHREATAALSSAGVAPANLRVAAGLGREDLVLGFFDDRGALRPTAGAARGFYRPHTGFPPWSPADDPQEVLDEALAWAARSDRTNVMPLLAERGARVTADVYRGTPLLWAAFARRVEAAAWLLAHGAPVDQRASFGGPTHGEGVTALHLAAANDDPGMVTLLLSHGADRSLQDALYHATPAGWAEHAGARGVAALLQ